MAYKPIIDTEEAPKPKKLPFWAKILIILGSIIVVVVAIVVGIWYKVKKTAKAIGNGILSIFKKK